MLGSTNEDHDQLDPAETLMREVGAQLRQVRLERGEHLDEVGQHLRIKAIYLLGIEQGDLSTMPGRTYALGFLRSYADYLGFDGDDLITQIKSTVANLTDKTRLRIRTPLPESRLPKTPILVLSLAAVAGIYAGWTYVDHGSQLVIETVAEVPASLRNLAFGAFRDDGDGIAPPAADLSPALPRRPPAGTGSVVHEARPAVARSDPLPAVGSSGASAGSTGPASGPLPATGVAAPERTAAAPATVAPAPSPPAPSPPAPLVAAPTLPRATEPAEGAGPGTPALPAIAPEAGPRPPPGAARAYALARPTAGSDALDEGAGPDDDSGAAGAGAAAGTGQDRLAALPLDPATIGPVGQIHEPDNTDARVVIRALESSWIQISSPAGDYLRDRTLEPNDVFLVPNRPDLELWTGNAGGLEVIVDGTVLAPLGTSGAVVRYVPLDPSSLREHFGRPLAR